MVLCFIDHTCFAGHGSRCTLQLKVQSSKLSSPFCVKHDSLQKKKSVPMVGVASSSILVAVFIQAFIQQVLDGAGKLETAVIQ